MALATIFQNGVNEIDVPPTQSISISNYVGGIAKIYYLITNANRPDAYQLQQTLENSGVTLGAFAAGQRVKIEAGNSKVTYDVGASPDTGIGNADTLNGLASDTTDTGDTIAARDGSGDIQANAFESTVTTGTAPLTVASTTLISNLNAERFNSLQTSAFALINGTDNGEMTIDNIDADLIIKDSTDTVANYFWRDYSEGTLKMGTTDAVVIIRSPVLGKYQSGPVAKTTDATLTAANLESQLITVNQGAAGTSTQTLPLATAMDSYFTYIANNYGFEFSVINISTNAAEDCTIATNTGWTLVGSMVVESFDADRARSTGRFFARKTGTGAWTLYRIA